MKQNFSSNQSQQIENSILKQKVIHKYDIYFEQNSYVEEIVYTSQISQDELYLLVGNNGCQIEVYDLSSKQLMKCIKLDGCIPNICIFTNDSNYIICGDSGGKILCYDVINDFQEIYHSQIHSDLIMDIIAIDDDQIITCSKDKSIMITNIKLKKEFLIIKDAHSHQINSIDYDLYNDEIISCSDDKSIKFFNRANGQLQFQQQMAHISQVQQIQLILNQNNLLSSSYDELKIWKVDFEAKQLIFIKELKQNIINFTFIANQNIIIFVCKGEVQILDKNLSLVSQIKCLKLRDYIYFRTRQLNSMNYIIVHGADYAELKVLKMNTSK